MASYERHGWLAKRSEEPIDPNRQIIDAHHHLWDRNQSRYLAGELIADTRGSHNVTHTVFVECSAFYDDDGRPELAPVGETRFVARQASEAFQLGGTQIAAIVAHADIAMGARVGEVLAAHDEAGQGLFRGVRHGTNRSPHGEVKNGHHDPAEGLMLDTEFQRGVATLGEMGLSFDAWLYFHQLDELAAMARSVPECVIVLNHLGGPLGIGPHASARAEMLEVWRSGLAEAAACDNVVLKVGGLGMEHYFGTPWSDLVAPPSSEEVADYWGDMVGYAIDTFGPQRCMFESNFPVDRQTLPYAVLWNAFQILGGQYDDDEQEDLFVRTAARAYRIDVGSDSV